MRRFHNIPTECCRKNKKVNELKAKQFILEKLESAMAEDKKNENIKAAKLTMAISENKINNGWYIILVGVDK